MRLRMYGLLAAAALACIGGCQAPGRFAILAKPGIHIGSTRIGYVLLPADYYALHPKLESLYDAPVLFNPDISGDAIAQHLLAGRRHFGIMSGGEFASIKDTNGLEIIAVGLGSDGTPMHKGLIITKAKSGISTISELKGKRFAFGPKHDLVLDHAAHEALRAGGLADTDIAKEIPIPPLTLSTTLYLGSGMDVAKAVAFDGGIAAGVMDEETYNNLPASGGNFLAGPSRDMFAVVTQTEPMPGMVVVAGPKTGALIAQKMRAFLLERVKPATEPKICEQLKVSGFMSPDTDLYKQAREMVNRP